MHTSGSVIFVLSIFYNHNALRDLDMHASFSVTCYKLDGFCNFHFAILLIKHRLNGCLLKKNIIF